MWVQVFAGLIAKPAKGARGSVNGDPKWTEVRMRHTYPAQTLPRTGRAVISPGYWGRGIGTLRSLWSEGRSSGIRRANWCPCKTMKLRFRPAKPSSVSTRSVRQSHRRPTATVPACELEWRRLARFQFALGTLPALALSAGTVTYRNRELRRRHRGQSYSRYAV